jgi:hypothetical protein
MSNQKFVILVKQLVAAAFAGVSIQQSAKARVTGLYLHSFCAPIHKEDLNINRLMVMMTTN